MSVPIAAAPLPGDVSSEVLLRHVFDVSLTGIQLLRPVYAAGAATPVDFALAYTNPAGLRIFGVSEPLSGTLLERFPHTLAAGVLAYYQRAFAANDLLPYEVNYQADGVDSYLQFQARRSENYLLVSFTDTSGQPRSAVEEALRASQAREQAALAEAERQRGELARVFELAPVAIAVYHGPEYCIELANPVSCHLLQRSADELLGKPLFEALPELAGQGFEQVLASVYTTGQPVLVQEQPGTHARAGQLDTLYWNLTFVPLRASDGHIIGVLSAGLDVTEQVLARQQAQMLTDELEARVQERSEAARVALGAAERERNLLQAVLTQAPVAISLFQGEELRIMAANVPMAAIWGRTPAQVLNQPLLEAVPELRGQGFDEQLRQVLRTQVPFSGTETPATMLRDGQLQTTYYNFVYQPLYAADGQVLGVINVAVEVTEQVLARQQLVQLNQELEARVHERTRQVTAAQAATERERARLQALIAQAPVAIALFEGEELRVTSANAVIAALWGYTTAQVLGRPLLEGVPELQGQGFDDLLRQVLHTQVPFSGTETPAVLLRDGQPQTSYYNFVYQPFYDAEGQVIGVLNVSTEVTEQVLARRQVEQLNQELEARVQARTQELHAQQALLQRVLDGIPAYAATLSGPAHRVSYANAAFQRLLGDRPLLGLPNADAVPEAVDQGLLAVLNQVYTSGQARTLPEVPLHLPQADGTMRPHYINTTYQPLPDAQGRPQDVLAFGVDVTEQVVARQQAAALQAELLAAAQTQAQTRESFYQVFEQTPALVALLRGTDHQFEYANPAYQALFAGRSLVGLAAAAAVPELFDQGFGSLLNRVYQTGETYFGLELPFTPAATAGQPARTSYYTFTYQALREAGVVTGISIFAYDVTAQLREREASAQQLRLITDSLPVLISYLDGEEIYRFVNQAYEPWFNQRAADLVGQSARAVVGEQAYQLAKPYIDRALAGEQVAFESRMPYREGFTKHIYSTFVPAKRAGVPDGFYSLIVDITDQVRGREQVQALNAELTAINAELHQSNAQLTRTNVDLDTFVYTASHDLKAPITNIESITLALRDTLPPDVQQDEMVAHLLDLLTHTTTRFQATIGQLTDLSKLQLAHAGPAEPVNLAAVVESVRLDLAPVIAAAAAQLTVEVAANLLASFSPANLRSAIYNLLSNAVKYRALDRPAQVRLHAYPAGGRVVLEVQDNGLGLNAHQQSRLFGLFQRLHTHVEGTGVGLYTTKRLVENGGGTIAVKSQEGVGTTFTLTFPA